MASFRFNVRLYLTIERGLSLLACKIKDEMQGISRVLPGIELMDRCYRIKQKLLFFVSSVLLQYEYFSIVIAIILIQLPTAAHTVNLVPIMIIIWTKRIKLICLRTHLMFK